MTGYGDGGYGGPGLEPRRDPQVPQQPGPAGGSRVPPPAAPVTGPPATTGMPIAAPSQPGSPSAGPSQPGSPSAGPSQPGSPRRLAWPGVLALVLVALLIPSLALQTWQVYRLDDRLATVKDELAQQQRYDQERIDALEARAGELERIAGEAFDPEAIAEAALPSVFRVRAGDAGGTAFAVGGELDGGGTHLFTNYHVVEGVWERGDREVTLERTDQRYSATIVDVDSTEDVALLETDTSFRGLTVASEPARSGQQVVAVGAPFGLTDTITVGVVSANRDDVQGAPGRWLQFDASINPGNSGGPVINAAHEVVGIATAGRLEAEGIGLARPIDVACDVFEVC